VDRRAGAAEVVLAPAACRALSYAHRSSAVCRECGGRVKRASKHESFDIGSDTLTGVNDADYKPPFALTTKLQAHDQGRRPQLSPADIKRLQAAMQEKAKAALLGFCARKSLKGR
jgi:hypothetical protein